MIFSLLSVVLVLFAWPHLFIKGQVPVDGNVLRLFYPNWAFLHAHPPVPWKWPLWNPCRDMGEPFLADPQSMATYPPMWLLCRLGSYLNFTRLWVLGHSLLAGYFMGKWVMRQTGVLAGAAASASIAALNGYFLAHGTLPNHFAAAAYVPAVFYFFDAGSVVGLGMTLALQWLTGFPPFSCLTGLTLFAWSLCVGSSKWKLLWQGTGLALGLSAFQLIPFVELFLHSSRPAFLDPAAAITLSEPTRQLLRMLFIPQWFAWQPQLIGDQAVVSLYLGPFVLLAAGWALWKGERPTRLVGLGVAGCFLLSLGAYLPGYSRLPFLHFFRFPANWLLLSMTGMAWLSGIGISILTPARRRWMGTALILVDLLAFAQYVRVPWFNPTFLEVPPPLARTLLSSYPETRLYHSPVITQALERQTLTEEKDYLSFKESLPPSYGMAFGLKEVTSYQVLKLARAEQFQDRLAAEGPASPLLGWAGVANILTSKSARDPWESENLQVVAVKNPRPLLFFNGSGAGMTIHVQRSEAGLIQAEVNTPTTNTLIYSEVSYPGWRVFIDGKRISTELFQDTFLSVQVPPGIHQVVFHFVSSTFWIGLVLSLGVVIGLLGAQVLWRVNRLSRAPPFRA